MLSIATWPWYGALVKGVLYPLHEHLKGKPTFAWLRRLEATQWLDAPRLHELQLARLREHLRFAYLHTPYYRELFDRHGIRPEAVRGLELEMRLTNPYFFRLYEMAQELELPICFHSGNNSFQMRDIYAQEGGFGRSKMPVVAAFHNLIMDDIPKKFPKLRWGFIEVSSQWVPWVIHEAVRRSLGSARRPPARDGRAGDALSRPPAARAGRTRRGGRPRGGPAHPLRASPRSRS